MMTEEIPKVQKAIVAEVHSCENYKLRIVHDYPVPQINDDEVLVRLTSTGVCHSDLSFLKNHWGLPMAAAVAGHEGSGYIVKQGKNVDPEKLPLKMRVGVPLVSKPCRTCDACNTADGEKYCTNSPFYGSAIDGTWQQYVKVSKDYVIPAPDNVDESVVGPVLCGGVTVYKGLQVLDCYAGQWVAITGAGGGLGSMAIQYAAAKGFRVIAIDTGDEKRDMCEKLGAELFVDFKKEDVVERIVAATKGGAHGALCLAPVLNTMEQAPQYMRLKGEITVVGLPVASKENNSGKFGVAAADLVFKGLTVRGSLVGSRADIIEALDFVARKKMTPPVKVYKMEDIDDILAAMEAGEIKGRCVLDLS